MSEQCKEEDNLKKPLDSSRKESGASEAPGDQFSAVYGDWGRWQTLSFSLVGLAVIICTSPTLIMTFMNAKIDFWCQRPQNIIDLDVEEWKALSGGHDKNCQIFNISYADMTLDEAKRMAKKNSSHETGMATCTAWEYDLSKFSQTLASEFDLVCGRKKLLSIGQTVYFFGLLCSGPLFGMLSDRFGRKPMLIAAMLMMAMSGLGSGLVPSFEMFLVFRFFTAMGAAAVFMLGMTYTLELCGSNWTTFVGLGQEFFWVIGWLSLGGLAYVFTNWRHLIMVTSAPGLLVVFYYCILLESPKWLLSVGRLEDAEHIARRMAMLNGRSVPLDWKLKKNPGNADRPEKQESNKVSIMDLFRTPQMCGKTLILYGNWFIITLTYYGLTLNSTDLGDDFHINFMINGAFEFPAYALALVLVRYTGRRVPYATSLAFSGLSLLSIMLVPNSHKWLVTVVAIVGKFFITMAFGIIYFYTNELFPTVIRGTGMGTSGMISRLGGICAGWLGLLKQYHVYIPTTIYGILAIFFATLAMALPETKGEKIPDTLEEGEQRKLISLRNMFSISGFNGSTKEELKTQVEDEECATNHLLKLGEADQSEKSIA